MKIAVNEHPQVYSKNKSRRATQRNATALGQYDGGTGESHALCDIMDRENQNRSPVHPTSVEQIAVNVEMQMMHGPLQATWPDVD